MCVCVISEWHISVPVCLVAVSFSCHLRAQRLGCILIYGGISPSRLRDRVALPATNCGESGSCGMFILWDAVTESVCLSMEGGVTCKLWEGGSFSWKCLEFWSFVAFLIFSFSPLRISLFVYLVDLMSYLFILSFLAKWDCNLLL